MSEREKMGIGGLGPAIIVAAVVCGPGSILTSSKVGAQFGYSMIWALAIAVILMIGTTALAARLGVVYEGTPCDELARRLGRPVAIFVGLVIFLVAAGFQTSNNLAIIKTMTPYLDSESPAVVWVPVGAVLLLNGFLIAIVYRSPHLYKPVEKAMKIFVFLMIAAFLANCVVTRPSLIAALKGLVPRLPDLGEAGGGGAGFFAVAGMMATTFSIAGAFYQAYLVRDKGWQVRDLKRGLIDSVTGILALGGITLVIMLTAAATFHGSVEAESLKSVTDVAKQLEGLFGQWAGVIFAVGILAGALSSFLVNSMIGGQFLADGLGKGRSMDTSWSRHGTVLALLAGLAGGLVAFIPEALSGEQSNVTPIIVAQACTVLGGPALAATLLYLGTRKDLEGERKTPAWVLTLVWLGLGLTLVIAVRTGMGLAAKFG